MKFLCFVYLWVAIAAEPIIVIAKELESRSREILGLFIINPGAISTTGPGQPKYTHEDI